MISVQQAKDKRDIWMARATDRANRERSQWSEDAFWHLKEYVRPEPFFKAGKFLAEEVIEYSRQIGFEAKDSRAWGSVFRRAAKEGIIRKVGYAPAKSSNLSPKTLWEAV